MDDEGGGITERDLADESHREPVGGRMASLLPPFDYEGSDEDWERQGLVDAVRARRRAKGS